MNVAVESPELGRSIIAGGYQTNLHEHGKGFPLMLIHGSGPGVTAWANWRLVMPELAKQRRVIAPDMLGFGYSERPANPDYQRDVWVEHAIGVLDALGIEQADLVGNSFGGGIALALAIRYPHRVRRLVLMGSVGVSFPITDGLDRVWGYEPSFQTMRSLMDTFAYDRALVTDELAELRYQASIAPGSRNPLRRCSRRHVSAGSTALPATRRISAPCNTRRWLSTGARIRSSRCRPHCSWRS